jgi:hypothetical protein
MLIATAIKPKNDADFKRKAVLNVLRNASRRPVTAVEFVFNPLR